MKPSAKFSLNEVDWKKWAKDCFIFCIPAILLLITQVQSVLPMHVPAWSLPLIGYALAQLTALLKKWAAGK